MTASRPRDVPSITSEEKCLGAKHPYVRAESCQPPTPVLLLTHPASPLQVTTATGRDGTGRDGTSGRPEGAVQPVDSFYSLDYLSVSRCLGRRPQLRLTRCCCCYLCLMSVSCPRPASILLIKRIPTVCFCPAFLFPSVCFPSRRNPSVSAAHAVGLVFIRRQRAL